MALSHTTILWIVELAIYLLLAPVILYLFLRHGKHGLLGFFYLDVFAITRIISDIIFIAQRNNTTPSEAAAIVSSIGLSPLLLALSGLTHEQHIYLVNATHSPARAQQIRKWMWIAQILIHFVALAAIALVVEGTIDLIHDTKPDSSASQSDIDKENHFREAGSVILLLVWLNVTLYAALIFRSIIRTTSPVRMALRTYGMATVIGSVFVGVRAVYSVTYSFDHDDASLSPITGSFAVKLVFVVLSFMAGAWKSRHVKNEQHHHHQPARSGSPGDRMELMQGEYKVGPGQV